MPSIAGREWLFPLGLAAFFVVLGSVPYYHGSGAAEADETFMGFIGRGTPGANSYFAFARQVAEGHHLTTNLYTPESPEHAYFNLEWWIMGQVARWSGGSLVAVFHLGRALSVLGFMLALYYLAGTVLTRVVQRRAALLLVTCGTGFGWLLVSLHGIAGIELPPSPDARGVNLFGYLANKPHFIRAGIFAALQYAWLIRGDQLRQPRYFLLAGLAAGAHGIIRPYALPESLVFVAAYGLLRWLGGTWRAPTLGRALLAFLVAVTPVLAWHALLFVTNPLGLGAFNAWAPALVLSQIIWFGLPYLAVLIYGVIRLSRGTAIAWGDLPVPVIWMGSALVLAQCHPVFPWGVESYFAWVLAPPLLFVGTVWPAIRSYLDRRGRSRLRWVAVGITVLAVTPGSLMTYGQFFSTLHAPQAPWQYYLPKSTESAIAWLSRESGDRVLLASHATSQFVPRLADIRVVTGQDVLTPNYAQRNQWVSRFYQSPGDDGFKRWLCETQGITHVLDGPSERAASAQDFSRHPWLHEIYADGGTKVYAVRLP